MEEYEVRALAVEMAVLWNRMHTDGIGRKERRAIEDRFDAMLSAPGTAVIEGAMAILRKYDKRPWGRR